MNIITKLQNLWTLYKWNKDVSKIFSPQRFFNGYKYLTLKEKGSCTRNLIASILKQLRTLYPYKIQDYSEVEKLYKEYFTLENHIASFEFLREKVKTEEVWVTCFRRDYPVKGKRYCEYFINSSGGIKTFKIDPREKEYGFVSDPFINEFGNSVKEENITQFKFATSEEIRKTKFKKVSVEKIEKEIELKREEITKLHSKLNKFK